MKSDIDVSMAVPECASDWQDTPPVNLDTVRLNLEKGQKTLTAADSQLAETRRTLNWLNGLLNKPGKQPEQHVV